MSMFFTTWAVIALWFMPVSIALEGCKAAGMDRRIGFAIAEVLFSIPAIYAFGWLFLPMALGR